MELYFRTQLTNTTDRPYRPINIRIWDHPTIPRGALIGWGSKMMKEHYPEVYDEWMNNQGDAVIENRCKNDPTFLERLTVALMPYCLTR
jgi:hypothetical protein